MTAITQDDPRWQSLYEKWDEERQPGYVTGAGGVTFRVLTPSDDTVIFVPMENINDLYNSTSTSGLTRHKS